MVRNNHLQSLTALRFLFFVFVFLSHYLIDGVRVLPNGGHFAVVFFLILSGFSLSYGYGERIGEIEYKAFIIKRVVQLYPMHLLTLLLRAIPILFIPLAMGRFEPEKVLSFGLNMVFLQAWIPNEDVIFSFNSCAWYLSPLVFCYLMFPFLYKWISNAHSRVLSLTVIGFVGIYAVCSIWIPSSRHECFLYAAPYFRCFDFY